MNCHLVGVNITESSQLLGGEKTYYMSTSFESDKAAHEN